MSMHAGSVSRDDTSINDLSLGRDLIQVKEIIIFRDITKNYNGSVRIIDLKFFLILAKCFTDLAMLFSINCELDLYIAILFSFSLDLDNYFCLARHP